MVDSYDKDFTGDWRPGFSGSYQSYGDRFSGRGAHTAVVTTYSLKRSNGDSDTPYQIKDGPRVFCLRAVLL